MSVMQPDRSPRRRWLWVLTGVVAIVVLVGGLWSQSQPLAAEESDPMTMSALSIPGAPPPLEWLKVAPSQVQEAYVWAAAHHDTLRYIPCYCGCSQAHNDNSDCYFDRNASGELLDYDSHALGCHTCVDITLYVKQRVAKGKSVSQIRREIDDKYKENGAAPTPTPMPQS
jgi:hypothetical protein